MEETCASISDESSRNSSRRNSERRRVSFPESELVSYVEPEDPLLLARNVTIEEIRKAYVKICKKYKTRPLLQIIDQIEKFDPQSLETAFIRQPSFEIYNENITSTMCETFEEIFKRVQFKELAISKCSLGEEATVSIFDMLEYYESANKLKINMTVDLTGRGGDAFQRYIAKSPYLEELEIENMHLKDNDMIAVLCGLLHNTRLETLRFRDCTYENRSSSFYGLALRLQYNYTLRELFLPHNGLRDCDSENLCYLVRYNTSLYLLDLSNNLIGDRGIQRIIEALMDKPVEERTLVVLILWNTGLTDLITFKLKYLFCQRYKLEVLNIGHNKITDQGFLELEDGLHTQNTVVRLGVQRNKLTDSSCGIAGRIITANHTLEQIDFRGNQITKNGLEVFLRSLHSSSGLLRADFDPTPFNYEDADEYRNILSDIANMCTAHQVRKDNDERKKHTTRKISLTCQTHVCTLRRSPPVTDGRANPGVMKCTVSPEVSIATTSAAASSQPHPTPTPAPKSRFRITVVSEPKPVMTATIDDVNRIVVLYKNVKRSECEGEEQPSSSSNGEVSREMEESSSPEYEELQYGHDVDSDATCSDVKEDDTQMVVDDECATQSDDVSASETELTVSDEPNVPSLDKCIESVGTNECECMCAFSIAL